MRLIQRRASLQVSLPPGNTLINSGLIHLNKIQRVLHLKA